MRLLKTHLFLVFWGGGEWNVGGDSEPPKHLLQDPPWLQGLSNRRIGMPCLVCEEAPDGKLVKLHF